MEIVCERVAAIDVGKKVIAVAVRAPGDRRGQRRQQLREFNTYHRTLVAMVAWLVAEGVTHVTMESGDDHLRSHPAIRAMLSA